jgi:S-DNA-T family DNA segregation ATPase FtsK/SpoIIIE
MGGSTSDTQTIQRAMADEQQIAIFIHDFGEFLNIVYTDSRKMNAFLEAATKKSKWLKMAFFAVIIQDDSRVYSGNPLFANFVGWKEGIHLGGQTVNLNSQKINYLDPKQLINIRTLF